MLAIGILALGAIALAFPSLVPMVPDAGTDAAFALLAFGLACLRACSRTAPCAPTRSPTAPPTCSSSPAAPGSASRSFAQLVIGPCNVAFYRGHALELGGIALIGIPTALDLARGGASRPLVGDLTATELVAAEEAYLGTRVRAAARAPRRPRRLDRGAHPPRRAARRPGRRGAQAPRHARRHLAVGGLLHDIGKLCVPLEILQKPGALTDEEFAEIQRHPEAGRRLLDELGGFSPVVRDLVSDHHERLDGTGYPRGLTEEELPLETRILAVCDVYDALVSDRVYRAAWTPERAFELLRDDTGTGFDERASRRSRASSASPSPRPSWVAGVAAARRAPGLPGSLRPTS